MLGISFKFAETLHSKLKAVDFGQTFESRLQAGKENVKRNEWVFLKGSMVCVPTAHYLWLAIETVVDGIQCKA